MQRMGASPAAAFHSAENKAVLWAALQEAGAFGSLAPGTERQVMSSIETRMAAAATSGSSSSDLTHLNKMVLQGVMADLAGSRDTEGARGQASAVDRAFSQKQAEIDAMSKGSRPRQIDFSDELDKPMGGEMGRAVQEVMNRRGHQLAATQAQQAGTLQEAQKWLGIDQNASRQAPVRQLKIGGLVGGEVDAEPLAARSAPAPRQVRFAEKTTDLATANSPSSALSFLSNLKRDETVAAPTPPVTIPNLDGINDSLKRIADCLTELVAAQAQAQARAGEVEIESPVPASSEEDNSE